MTTSPHKFVYNKVAINPGRWSQFHVTVIHNCVLNMNFNSFKGLGLRYPRSQKNISQY